MNPNGVVPHNKRCCEKRRHISYCDSTSSIARTGQCDARRNQGVNTHYRSALGVLESGLIGISSQMFLLDWKAILDCEVFGNPLRRVKRLGRSAGIGSGRR